MYSHLNIAAMRISCKSGRKTRLLLTRRAVYLNSSKNPSAFKDADFSIWGNKLFFVPSSSLCIRIHFVFAASLTDNTGVPYGIMARIFNNFLKSLHTLSKMCVWASNVLMASVLYETFGSV